MLLFLAIAATAPLAAFFLSRRAALDPEPPRQTFRRTVALFALGLVAALPFVTGHRVGTSEAYNYSLAVADAVTQMRSGEIPPLVGQTEFAFNGRIHPLRDAPYLFYLAGGIDLLAFRQLTFWQLQNLSLVLSVVAAVFACYASLRWATACTRSTAFLLAAAYAFAPGLQVALTVNLFMTVYAAPFLPIALGACLRHCRVATWRNDVVMTAALAAAWLAHPPVAFWLTAGVGVIRLLILWHNPSWQARLGLLAALVLGFCLAAFVFASVFTLDADLDFFRSEEIIHANYVTTILQNLRAAFPGSLLPVTAGANALTDFQLGYVGWFLLLAAAIAWCGVGRKTASLPPMAKLAGLGLVAVAAGLLVLTLPVPGVTRWLWEQVPISVMTLTNVWPMQRLYVVAIPFVLFSAALLLPAGTRDSSRPRPVLLGALVLAAGWTLWEGSAFLRSGFAQRASTDTTVRDHLASNLDLTVTSYAFVGLPSTFVHGTMDPRLEFRLLKNGRVLTSQLDAALATAGIVARGDIFLRQSPAGPAAEVSTQRLTLEPGRRYLLVFDFLAPPFKGTLEILGPALRREYLLPAAGEPNGFGMGASQPHALPLWTALNRPEPVELRLHAAAWPAGLAEGAKLAAFTLREYDPARLPVQVESLLPLRFTVTSPAENTYVATPRSFLRNYVATVNGRTVRQIRSPDFQAMVPVPKGTSFVELRYVAAPLLRRAFWLSAVCWLGLLACGGAVWMGLDLRPALARPAAWFAAAFSFASRFWLPLFCLAAVLGAAKYFWRQRSAYLASIGPVRLHLLLPLRQTGLSEPILTTGKTGAGTTVFVTYADAEHVRIGADIWGSLYQTEPLEVDYFEPHEIVINSSALYPLDHPRVAALRPEDRERLRHDFRVELDGKAVITQQRLAYESSVAQVTVGQALIGGSLTQRQFRGEILEVERIPPPRQLLLAHGESLRIRTRFPLDHGGRSESLFSLGLNGEEGAAVVTYFERGHLRVSQQAPDGALLGAFDLRYDAFRAHDLEFNFGALAAEPDALRFALKFDGQPVGEPLPLAPLPRAFAALAGLNPVSVTGVEPRFSGADFSASLSPEPPRRENRGPVRLVLAFPTDKLTRAEPLLTTGKTGAGDFAYVVYVDETHVRFGLDHWGVGGALSDPIAVDYRRLHDITIEMDSLNSNPAANPKQMLIRLDGRVVAQGNFAAHPTTPAEITPGLNQIGGSNCDPAFTGQLLLAERMGE